MSKLLYLSDRVAAPMLVFLWRWKLVSTEALARRFFPRSKSFETAYNRLTELKKHHYVEIRRDEEGKYQLWALGRAGFRAIRNRLPVLHEEGYISETPYHDWLASSLHIGNWLVECPAGIEVFSEQQLRRYDPDHYPDWVPRDPGHRPDGYWHRDLRGESRTIALEIEITRKKAAPYQTIGSFYGEAAQVNRVLWVVRSQSDAEFIRKNLDKGPGSRSAIHSFVLLHSFLQFGWSAPIVHGAGLKLTIESFLRMALGYDERAFAVPSPCRGTAMALLQTRIKRIPSATSGSAPAGQFSRPTIASAIVSPAPLETRPIVPPEVSR